MAQEIFDVAVIGYGPVGMATAALLGRLGHRVVVLERYPGKYNLPRAATFDDETMRSFAVLGIADELLHRLRVQHRYEWCNADGDLLLEHRFSECGTQGWAEWYMMYQPDLEDALDAACQAQPTVSVRFAAPVAAVEQDAASCTLTLEGGQYVRARYVVACDGGNSFVRNALGIQMTDHGFSEPWLVCDFRLLRPVDIPFARQIGDPAQPISIVSIGLEHHRFSFMLDASADVDTERQPERVWARVRRFLGPDDAELIRAAGYTFHSRIAQEWRRGRILLAGDAAHQMPPFLGQGMCSGVRDALNLHFKLDLVLSGKTGEALLDTYQVEREPHVTAVMNTGIELGRLQTTRDPALAATRDEAMLAQRRSGAAREKLVFPALHGGMLSDTPAAGELFVQGRIAKGGRTGLFDAVAGLGPVILVRAAGDRDGVASPGRKLRSETRVLEISSDRIDDGSFADIDGVYTAWLDVHGCDAVAVRPDFHVWGTAKGDDVETMIRAFDLAFSAAAEPVETAPAG